MLPKISLRPSCPIRAESNSFWRMNQMIIAPAAKPIRKSIIPVIKSMFKNTVKTVYRGHHLPLHYFPVEETLH